MPEPEDFCFHFTDGEVAFRKGGKPQPDLQSEPDIESIHTFGIKKTEFLIEADYHTLITRRMLLKLKQ